MSWEKTFSESVWERQKSCFNHTLIGTTLKNQNNVRTRLYIELKYLQVLIIKKSKFDV